MRDIINRIRAHKGDEGFTLIELLVVVVIIGVLVAIAVPVYLNYRAGAADKSAQSDVRGAISAMEQYYTDNNNAYPPDALNKTATFALGTSTTAKVTLSDKSEMTIVVSGSTYKICAKNSGGSTNRFYKYDSAAGGSVQGVTSATFSMTTCS
ncbi:prepilin-type N-terminal cleavage/methylation domain-containing protein [Krasilnikovia sp. M28-CT-15]|uniref:prepilin-type N-terminal cleavage/methylation domain-containing protein n=1 Tax=Krasilnikovia sp. M28-CT-15 TaxID=3373540 RepID=UPI003875B1D0